MTIQRMIELLKIEHECMLRLSHDDCDRNCADCDLVQDDGDLHEMYTNVIALLKEQEPVEPYMDYDGHDVWQCGKCGATIFHIYHNESDKDWKSYAKFCRQCGKAVKWDA